MTDHSSSSPSSPQESKESIPKSLQNLKIKPEENPGTISGDVIAMPVAPSLRLPQQNVLGHETYNFCFVKTKTYKSKKKKHTKIQNWSKNQGNLHL